MKRTFSIPTIPLLLLFTGSASAQLLGQGSPQQVLHRFHARTTHRVDPPPVALLGDVDGDGLPDFALGQALAGGVEVRRGADGAVIHFIPDPGLNALYATTLARLDDIDEDGVSDLAVGSSHRLAVGSAGFVELRSGADGMLLQRFPGPLDASFGRTLEGFEDLDGDGLADLIVGTPENFASASAPTRVQAISSADGTAIWTVEAPNSHNLGHSLARLGDLDGDGVDEVAVASFEFLVNETLILSGVDGAVFRRLPDTARGPLARAGDLDGDGLDELAVADLRAERRPGQVGIVRLFRGSDGSLLRVLRPPGRFGAFGVALDAGDVNGDGIEDLIVGQSILEAIVFEGGGYGAVAAFSGRDGGLLLLHRGPERLAELGNAVAFLGDADGDGASDLVATGLFRGPLNAFGIGLSGRSSAPPPLVEAGVVEGGLR